MSMVMLLMFQICGMSLVSFSLNMNMIMMMMVFVVSSIFTFVTYYMDGDVGNGNFKLLKIMFLTLMVLMLSSFGLLMFVGWEGIGVLSMCLIGYWMRPMAKSGAMSAMMYNRWSDLVFLMFMFVSSEVMVMLLMMAIMCKSSLYLFQYWLPIAMESPTPVSSLLHSSTMVVAGIYLMMLMPIKISLVMVVLVLGMNMVSHMDVKKNIAYSTSIHLVVMMLLSCSSFYSVVVVYIMLHGMIKSQLFQSSGYEIHGVGSQDMRKFSMVSSSMMMFLAMMLLSAMVSMVMVGAKEVVVLGMLSILMMLVMVLSMIYTVVYLNKSAIMSKVGQAEGSYVLVVMLMSMMVVDVNFGVWLSLLLFGLVLMIFYGNSMSTVV